MVDAERRAVAVARRLLAVIEENWGEPWLQSMLRGLDEPAVPKELMPEALQELAILIGQKA